MLRGTQLVYTSHELIYAVNYIFIHQTSKNDLGLQISKHVNENEYKRQITRNVLLTCHHVLNTYNNII